MGGASSTLMTSSQIKTGDELFAKTKDVREMSNALFQFMYSQWPRDEYLDIATKSDQYVIAISDLILEQFNVIGYTTARNQIGEIYFKRHSDLTPSKKTESGVVKQRENAQIIAFYFVRLFQILGSLLIVVKDISFPIETPINQTVSGRAMINQSIGPLDRFRALNKSQTGGGIGGISLGKFEFLRYYLKNIPSDVYTTYARDYNTTLDPSTTYMFKDSENLFFKYKPLTAASEFLILTANQKNKPDLKSQGVIVSKLNIKASTQVPYDQFEHLSVENQLDQYPLTVTFDLTIGGRTSPQVAIVNRVDGSVKKESYLGGAEYEFESGVYVDAFIGRYAADSKTQFIRLLEDLVIQAIKTTTNDKMIRPFIVKGADTVQAGPKVIEVGKLGDDNMKGRPAIEEIYKYLLNKNKNVTNNPHCISRALQLLDAASIEKASPLSAKTRICKFAVGDFAGSISLAKYIPTKSIAQLYGKVNPLDYKNSENVLRAFVGPLATNVPLSISQITGKEEIDSLQSAIERLAAAFNFVSNTPAKSFDDIVLARPAECRNRTGELEVTDTKVLSQLQTTAQQLMAYHINHIIDITKFLKTIFNIQQRPNGTWMVEGPKTEILFAGFVILDQITDQARDLLVDYYSGCESLYQKGLKAWTGFEAEQAKAAAVSAPVPVGGPGGPGGPLPPGGPGGPLPPGGPVPPGGPLPLGPPAAPAAGGYRRKRASR